MTHAARRLAQLTGQADRRPGADDERSAGTAERTQQADLLAAAFRELAGERNRLKLDTRWIGASAWGNAGTWLAWTEHQAGKTRPQLVEEALVRLFARGLGARLLVVEEAQKSYDAATPAKRDAWTVTERSRLTAWPPAKLGIPHESRPFMRELFETYNGQALLAWMDRHDEHDETVDQA